ALVQSAASGAGGRGRDALVQRMAGGVSGRVGSPCQCATRRCGAAGAAPLCAARPTAGRRRVGGARGEEDGVGKHFSQARAASETGEGHRKRALTCFVENLVPKLLFGNVWAEILFRETEFPPKRSQTGVWERGVPRAWE